MTLLRETVEACDFLSSGHLRDGVVTDLAKTCMRRCGPDLGVGPAEVRQSIQRCLRDLPKSPMARRELKYIVESLEDSYLETWSKALEADPEVLPVEEASRVIAGHLLGAGHSPESLHRWTTWLSKSAKPSSVSEIAAAAADVSSRRIKNWEVLVPFRSLESHGQTLPKEWLSPAAATAWLKENVPTEVPLRQNGGFLISTEAIDAWAAVEIVSDLVESLAARVSVGVPGTPRFQPLAKAYVSGSANEFPLGRPRRQVDIHALKRQNALYDLDLPGLAGRLRSALDLVSSLETGAPGAAVSGGWAAIEALLSRPDTSNVEAADDLAVLVACSFPRAELTTLSYAYESAYEDQISKALSRAETNQERCRILTEELGANKMIGVDGNLKPSDQAAMSRVQQLLGSPTDVLARVRCYVAESIRRLYRQRNLVLHAGITDSIAMTTTLRTVPPLVGAGMDRLVHEALVTGSVDPLELVARGRVELRLSDSNPSNVLELLGHSAI